MPLPPRGDPQRPLALAIRSTRLLGILLIAFSLLLLIPAMLISRRAGLWGASAVVLIVIATFYAGPGVLYLICSIFMKQRKTWAVVVALVLASLNLILTLFSGIGLLLNIHVAPGQTRVLLVPLGIMLVFVAAFGQLIFHLSRSFTAIRTDPVTGHRGFTPVLIQPVGDQTIRPSNSPQGG
jgi:hypothetical protein